MVIADLDPTRANDSPSRSRGRAERASAVRVDVTDREPVRAGDRHAVERHGRLDAYFNNAGMNAPMKFLDVTEANFELVMRVNALSVLIGTQEAARQFLAQGGGGKVVNTASIAGRQGFASFAPYSAAKAAVISLTQAGCTRARRARDHGQRLRPGRRRDPALDEARRDLEEIGEGRTDSTRCRRGSSSAVPPTPQDIVPTAIFLAASDSDYITGQIIPIEGGMILV